MDSPLPSLPADLWPKSAPVSATRQDEGFGFLALEVPSLSERPLLSVLSRGIHREMEDAGKWAARISPADKDKFIPTPRDFSRLCAEDAARLLAIYTAAYQARDVPSELELSPEALKVSASRAYSNAFQSEKQSQEKSGASYNDGLYRQVQAKRSGKKADLHP